MTNVLLQLVAAMETCPYSVFSSHTNTHTNTSTAAHAGVGITPHLSQSSRRGREDDAMRKACMKVERMEG